MQRWRANGCRNARRCSQRSATSVAWPHARAHLGTLLAAGEIEAARALFEESLELFRQLGDSMLCAEALNALGDIARTASDYAHAERLYADALSLVRAGGGGSGLPALLHNLGRAKLHTGDHRAAVTLFVEALDHFRPSGDWRGLAECVWALAAVAAAAGEDERAVRLLAAAEGLLEPWRLSPSALHVREYERDIQAARAHLDGCSFARAWAERRSMSVDRAVAYAAGGAHQGSAAE